MATTSSARLRSLAPVRQPGVYTFVSVPDLAALAAVAPVATIREPEGWSAVVTEHDARALGLPVVWRAAWILMSAQTALEEVGITAAFAQALAAVDISCNVIAGLRHDHLFVPVERADDALVALRRLGLE